MNCIYRLRLLTVNGSKEQLGSHEFKLNWEDIIQMMHWLYSKDSIILVTANKVSTSADRDLYSKSFQFAFQIV